MRFDGSSYNFAHRHRSGKVLPSRLARIAISAMVAAAFLIGMPAATAQEFSRSLVDKADPWVLRALEGGGSEEFLVVLSEQADVSGEPEGSPGRNGTHPSRTHRQIWRVEVVGGHRVGRGQDRRAQRMAGRTDGLLLVPYLMGLRGDQFTAGAIGMAPGRTAAPAIQAYIESLIP